MKANELMLEDWVTCKKWKENPFKLTRINDNRKYYYGITFNGTQVGPFLLDEIEPIPLTPEILEQNGFERSKVFVEWKYENDDMYIIYKPFPYLKIQMEECIVAFPCEYIHQLQHALRLCGINHEIIL